MKDPVTAVRIRGALSAALLVAITTWAPAARAQVTALRDLSFGTVVTGTTTAVAPTAAGAAMWRVRGVLGVGSALTFTLPTALTRAGGGSITVTFCSTCALYRVNNSNPSGATAFNPANGAGLVVVLLSDIYVWLGASVSPPLNQSAGHYAGTVVLTAAGLL